MLALTHRILKKQPTSLWLPFYNTMKLLESLYWRSINMLSVPQVEEDKSENRRIYDEVGEVINTTRALTKLYEIIKPEVSEVGELLSEYNLIVHRENNKYQYQGTTFEIIIVFMGRLTSLQENFYETQGKKTGWREHVTAALNMKPRHWDTFNSLSKNEQLIREKGLTKLAINTIIKRITEYRKGGAVSQGDLLAEKAEIFTMDSIKAEENTRKEADERMRDNQELRELRQRVTKLAGVEERNARLVTENEQLRQLLAEATKNKAKE